MGSYTEINLYLENFSINFNLLYYSYLGLGNTDHKNILLSMVSMRVCVFSGVLLCPSSVGRRPVSLSEVVLGWDDSGSRT